MRSTSIRPTCAILALCVLASCAKSPPPAPIAAAPAPPPAPMPMPRPPAGAAANLTLPAPLADGSFASPNRGLSEPATLWHLRAGLNVAALHCDGTSDSYNRIVARHKTGFAGAHQRLTAEYRSGGGDWQDRFDDAMTRLYNHYAQPPATRAFCAAAGPVLAQVEAATPDTLASIAPAALASLDKPFTDYWAAYHRYRTELAAWRAGQRVAAPRLAVDPAALRGRGEVTYAGRVQVAAR